jgi:predicted amidohydrolase
MPKLVVASVQQQMRLFDSPDSYRKELTRFLNIARAKGAELLVFPALTGVMAASHKVEGFRVNLLKQADDRQRGKGSVLARTRSALAGSTASFLGASFRKGYTDLLQADAAGVAAAYEAIFSESAKAYEITIVAGSAYLPDADGVIRHRVTVFGPDGAALGVHDKLLLVPDEAGLATAGEAWRVVRTPVGRLGIVLGEEALYPETGRVLAYQGADLLVTLAASSSEALAAYVRHGAIAQAQENRCFAMSSFLVGKNRLAHDENTAAGFVGRSGIYAPLEMTPRYSGVLVEMGTSEAEGLITAELDRDRLQELWENGVEPVRRRMPVNLFAGYLPNLYDSRRTLDDAWLGTAAVAPSLDLLPPPGTPQDRLAPVVDPTDAEATGQHLVEEGA